MNKISPRTLSVGIWLFATVVLVLHAWYYMPFIADDALISLRYADRLLHGMGLTWTDGPRVEGYSNLSWVLACALMGKFGFDLIDGARILGIIGMSAAIAAVVYAYRPRTTSFADILSPLTGALVLSFSGTIAVWSIGGLEQPFVAAFLAWMIVLLLPVIKGADVRAKSLLLPGIFAGLLCLTRPDSPLFIATTCIAILFIRGVNRKAITLLGVFIMLPLICVLCQLAFRLDYYGEWVPNTARVKLALSSAYLLSGALWLMKCACFYLPIVGVGVLAIKVVMQKTQYNKKLLLYLITLSVVWIGYVLFIGGDIFPAWRHVIPIIVIASFLVAELLPYCLGIHTTKFVVRFIAMALIAFIVLQSLDTGNKRARDERWEWQDKCIATIIKKISLTKQPLIAVDAAGGIPYFTGFPCIDMLGLNDYYIGHHPPADKGQKFIGHGMGDGKYVLGREPDIIVFGVLGADTALYLSGIQMQQTPDFFNKYAPVKLQWNVPVQTRGLLWVKKENGDVGNIRNGDTLIIPGWMATEDEKPSLGWVARGENASLHHWFEGGGGRSFGVCASLDTDGSLSTIFSSASPARIYEVALSAGAWCVRIEPEDSQLNCSINNEQNQTNVVLGSPNNRFILSDSTHVDIAITPIDSLEHRLTSIRLIHIME